MPEKPISSAPQSHVLSRKRTRFSLIWLVPIAAAAVGAWVFAVHIMSQGPSITLILKTAEGLDAGKTKIEYNGVEVGTLVTIALSDDHRNVVATAQMQPGTEKFLVEDSRFWVVKPRISGASISGLGTLISGSYIAMEIGDSTKGQRKFVTLDDPPVVAADSAGKFVTLTSPDLGSLDAGTPVFFRRVEVGEVVSSVLADDGNSLTIKLFVQAPYDRFLNGESRFWDASGVDVSLTADGLDVRTQSIVSILIGGIAFESPTSARSTPIKPDQVFTLFRNRTEAFQKPARAPQTYVLEFNDSVRGLVPGAPVEFRGIPVGEVVSIDARLDMKTFRFSAPVTIRLEPTRLGIKLSEIDGTADEETLRRKLVDHLVANGLRAQLRSGSLITGALFVAFDTFPDAAPTTVDWSTTPVELPTIPGDLQVLEASVANILKKVDQMPIKEIGEDLRKAMAQLDLTLVSAREAIDSGRGTLDSANKLIEPNSVLDAQLNNTLQDVSRAARSLNGFLDYLERHPEALIRGKGGDSK